jgi:hypothetical protein
MISAKRLQVVEAEADGSISEDEFGDDDSDFDDSDDNI